MKNILLTMFLVAILFSSCSDEAKWEKTQKQNTIEEYQKFLQAYPDSKFSEDAKSRIIELEYVIVKETNTVESYSNFIKKYPNSKYVNNANSNIVSLEFDEVKQSNTITAYDEFIEKYPNTASAKEAELIKEEILNFVYNITNSNYRKKLRIFKNNYPVIYQDMYGKMVNKSTYGFSNSSNSNKGIEEFQSYIFNKNITLKHFDMVNFVGCIYKESAANKGVVGTLDGLSSAILLNVIIPLFVHNLIQSAKLTSEDRNNNHLKKAIYELIIDNRKYSDEKLNSQIKSWIEDEKDVEFKSKLERLL